MLKKREYIFKNSQTNVLITNPRRSLKLPSCHFWDPVHGIFGFIYVWKREIHSKRMEEKTQMKCRNKKGELCFGGRWAPKLTKGSCNSSNWAQDPMKVWKLSWRISSFSIFKNTLCWFWEKKLIFLKNTFI